MVEAKMTTRSLAWATDGMMVPQEKGNIGRGVALEGKTSLILDMLSLRFSGSSTERC